MGKLKPTLLIAGVSTLSAWLAMNFRLAFGGALELVAERGFKAGEIPALPDLRFVSRSSQSGELRGRVEI